MPAANSANTQAPLSKFRVALRVFFQRARAFWPARWILLIAGIASIGYAQYLVEQRIPQGQPIPDAEFWNAIYRLDIVNHDNVYFALPYFLGGAFLCALTAMPAAWKNQFINWASHWPLRANISWRSSSIVIGIISMAFLLIQLGRHLYMPIYLFFWLISICVFTHLFWKGDRKGNVDLSWGFSPIDFFWVTGLLILGFSIASFALQDIPIAMVPDEGNFWETARAIALHDNQQAFFDSGVYTFPIASSIFQGWVLRVFGLNFWAWRFSSVIAGVITVIPLYLLAKEWFDRYAAVVAGIMMLANPYFIAFARLGYNNSQSLFPVTLCFYFLALGARKGSVLYFWLAGLTAGLGFYTYFASWIGLVTLCFTILYLIVIKELKWKRAFSILSLMLLGWAVAFAPRIAYTASGEQRAGLVYKIYETSFVNTFYARVYYGEADLTQIRPLIHVGGRDPIFYDPLIYNELLFRGTVRTLLALFDPYIAYEHFLNTGLAGVITPVFFLIGLALSLRYRKQLRFGLPLIWFLGGIFFLSIIGAFPPRHTHLVSVIPALALISGAGLMAVTDSLTELTFARRDSLRSMARTALTLFTSLAIIYFGFQRYYTKMPITYLPLFEDVVSWIARRTIIPVNLIYLSETEQPHRVEYFVKTAVVSHQYRSSLIEEFSPETDLTNVPTIIFIEGSQAVDTSRVQNPPAGFYEPVE